MTPASASRTTGTPDLRRQRARVVGGGLIVLGSLSLGEGWRLYGLRTQMVAGAVVGDDTFPLIVGASMVALGVLAAFVTAPATLRVVFPYGEPRGRMLVTGALLVVYWLPPPPPGATRAAPPPPPPAVAARGRARA